MNEVVHHFSIVGFAMVLAFIAGRAAHYFHVPKVSAYILVGILLGPTALNEITFELAEDLGLINQLAFGLILFNIGGEFHKGLLKKITRTHIKYSFAFSLIIFLTVTLICFLFSLTTSFSWAQRLVFSSFLGVVAIDAAPPTVLLVIKELEAKGPLSSSIMVFLAVSVLTSIFGAQVLIYVIQDFGFWNAPSDFGTWYYILMSIWSIVGSLLLGTALGLMLCFWEQREDVESELLFAVLVALLLGQSLAIVLKLEPLFVSLFMGFVIVNTSPQGQLIHSKMKGMGLSIYALFFILAGAHIHIQEQIKTVGLLGLGYVLARIIAMVIGGRIAASLIPESSEVKKFMGISVLSHAGAALAIASKIMHESDPSAKAIVQVILGSIFIFEIIGPLALRWSLVAVGEVKMGALLGGGSTKASLSMVELLQNALDNLGIVRRLELTELKLVKLLVRRHVYAIESTASIKDVISFVDKHHMPIYPVVDEKYSFLGTISLADLKDVIFDPFRSRYSYASKLIGSRISIPESATCQEAIDIFNEALTEVLPVVDETTNKLVGTLSYKDVVMAIKN